MLKLLFRFLKETTQFEARSSRSHWGLIYLFVSTESRVSFSIASLQINITSMIREQLCV